MIHRYVFTTVAMGVVLVLGAITALAQVGELRGKVVMQQTDGTKVPLADTQIDVFRTDVKGEYHTKTNKKGEFVFAGLPFVGEYTIAASHPTATPNFLTKFKVGRGVEANITVTPGNGKRLTAEEMKGAVPSTPSGDSAASPSGSSGESASDRAKREELIRKNKEIEEGNKKVTETNAIIQRTFKAGNDALTAAAALSATKKSDESIQKYSEALTHYDEGLVADPEQVALLTNKAQALKGRAIEKFNQTVLTANMDEAAKKTVLESAKADFRSASVASNKAVELIKAQPVPTDPAELVRFNANKYAALSTNSESMRLFVSKADGTAAEAGLAAFRDYLAVETDPIKKTRAQLDAAQMMLEAGAVDQAIAEFQQILATEPDNPDANLGAGIALYASGDKAKFQDAANYLQRFVDVAADNHRSKQEAKLILDELKSAEKVEPVKTPPPRRRRP